jgi:PmbA protein
MGLVSKQGALDLARALVAESPADETEITVESVVDRYVRYAADGPTQSADRERVTLSARVRLLGPDGRREARATCEGLDRDAGRDLLERATALASQAPPSAELLPLGGRVEVPSTRADASTLEHAFEEKARWIRAALDASAAAGQEPAGLARTSGRTLALLNSAGRSVQGASSRASFSLTASAPGFADGSGFAESIGARVGELDPAGVVERAVAKAVASQHPLALEPGEYTVVLEPPAVSALLLFATGSGFGAQQLHEQSSFLCGRVGEKLFPAELELFDDWSHPSLGGFAFDGEGSPRQRLPLIEAGVLRGPVTDAFWAHKLGLPNSGHALALPNAHGPRPEHPVLSPGRASLQELLAGVERGLLVSQFHYTNLIDPRELLLTGMTRNGTFLIERGRVGPPVKNLRFTQSLVEALARVSGVGREMQVAGALFDGTVVTPALRIEGFRFTSGTDF